MSRLADADRGQIHQLAEQGFGTRRIAKCVGCSRDTVRRQLDPNYREAEAERKREGPRESDAGEPDGGGGTLALIMLGVMIAYSAYRRWRIIGPGDPEADRQPPDEQDGR
jgi:hypothetical protein